jgi:hypothetical protein
MLSIKCCMASQLFRQSDTLELLAALWRLLPFEKGVDTLPRQKKQSTVADAPASASGRDRLGTKPRASTAANSSLPKMTTVYYVFKVPGNADTWNPAIRGNGGVAHRMSGVTLVYAKNYTEIPDGAVVLICHVESSRGLVNLTSDSFERAMTALTARGCATVILVLRPIGKDVQVDPLDYGSINVEFLKDTPGVEVQCYLITHEVLPSAYNESAVERLENILKSRQTSNDGSKDRPPGSFNEMHADCQRAIVHLQEQVQSQLQQLETQDIHYRATIKDLEQRLALQSKELEAQTNEVRRLEGELKAAKTPSSNPQGSQLQNDIRLLRELLSNTGSADPLFYLFGAEENAQKWKRPVENILAEFAAFDNRPTRYTQSPAAIPENSIVLFCHVAFSQGLYPQMTPDFQELLKSVRAKTPNVVLLGLRTGGAANTVPLTLGENDTRPALFKGLVYIEVLFDTRGQSPTISQYAGPSIEALRDQINAWSKASAQVSCSCVFAVIY